MLDVRSYTREFPIELRPIGEDTWEKETFEQWWSRCAKLLPNLHPQIAEQWVFRHYSHSPYSALPVQRLAWQLEEWTPQQVVDRAFIPGGEFNPEFDYGVFAGRDGTRTGRPFLAHGTWDYPILTLRTPDGVRSAGREYPDCHYLLVEGHQRMRMINAMYALGKELMPVHRVFVLTL